MAEWLIEQGIGEERAVQIVRGRIAAARLHWPGRLVEGQVEEAKLVTRWAGTPRGAALFANGERALVDKLPASASEGATMRLEVTRPRIWEAGRTKTAQSRPTEKPLQPPMGLAEQLRRDGEDATVVRRFPQEIEWTELWQEADAQRVEFTSGSLNFYPTPAMLLVDIDGEDDAVALALAAVEPLARTLPRFDLGGNIGIDFPTIADKIARKRLDAALEDALLDWPHERTAINGFGFVQIVARLERPSLLNLINHNRGGAKARQLLREAERIDQPGDLLLNCVDWVAKTMRDEWIAELMRRTGRKVQVRVDPERADLEACYVQAIAR